MSTVFDARACQLGEGPLWHPLRQQLFWVDLLAGVVHTHNAQWSFDGPASALGWVDRSTLVVAAELGLWQLNVETGERTERVRLPGDPQAHRTNDGRADPWGGFWVSTMAHGGAPEEGAIYRVLGGEVRNVVAGLGIPNAICVSPTRAHVNYADSRTRQVRVMDLDPDSGWPVGEARPWPGELGVRYGPHVPDGAVMDEAGRLWLAQWGSGRVAAYGPDGEFACAVPLPASQVTCPAFGGADRRTLYVTSAYAGLGGRRGPADGQGFEVSAAELASLVGEPVVGQAEPPVRL